MADSSFYGDTPNYATDYPTQNDGNTNPVDGNTPSPGSFYPNGGNYVPLVEGATLLAELQALEAQTESNATSAANSATAAAASAAAAASSGSAGTATPLVDGTATVGTSSKWAHEDHVHPTDTSRASVTYVDTQDALKAPLASPALTGVPTAPTATVGNSSTQIATTAFVQGALPAVPTGATLTPPMDGTAAVGTSAKWAHEDHVHPKDSTKTDLATFLLAIPVGQCKLSLVSTTQIALKPFNGNNLKINGALQSVPAAGVTYTVSSLAASTLYYVYAWMNAGTMTLELSATGHSTSSTAGNVGTEIKTGDDTRTLVGVVYTNASTQFTDSAASRLVRSWFNDSGVNGTVTAGAVVNTTSTAVVELDTSMRMSMILWTNEMLNANNVSQSFASVANAIAYNFCLLDGGIAGNAGIAYSVNANTQAQGVSLLSTSAGSDGIHTLSMGMQSSAGTSTANYASRTLTFNTLRR